MTRIELIVTVARTGYQTELDRCREAQAECENALRLEEGRDE